MSIPTPRFILVTTPREDRATALAWTGTRGDTATVSTKSRFTVAKPSGPAAVVFGLVLILSFTVGAIAALI